MVLLPTTAPAQYASCLDEGTSGACGRALIVRHQAVEMHCDATLWGYYTAICHTTRTSMVWYGMVEVCEGAPVAMGGWAVISAGATVPCADTLGMHGCGIRHANAYTLERKERNALTTPKHRPFPRSLEHLQ